MIPGPDVVIACPSCGAFAKYEGWLTGNDLGRQMWSDGKTILPMLPMPPPLVRCHACRNFYWLAAARVIEEIAGQYQSPTAHPPNPRWRETPDIAEPDEDDYQDMLENHLPEALEPLRVVRRLAFQRRNDRFRARRGLDDSTRDPPDAIAAGLWRDNLVALLAFYPTDGSADQLMLRGEILRGLRRFEEAAATYERIRAPELRLWSRKLAGLSARRISTVRLLT